MSKSQKKEVIHNVISQISSTNDGELYLSLREELKEQIFSCGYSQQTLPLVTIGMQEWLGMSLK